MKIAICIIFLIIGFTFIGMKYGKLSTANARQEKTMTNADGSIDIYDYATKQIKKMKPIVKSKDEWRKVLTPEQYYILREEGTERPFTHPLNDNKKKGVYKSAASGVVLFHSDQKFESGTGWPSFFDVVAKENIELREDNSLFMTRIEVVDKISGSHLGHVFNDGPPPTGLRYCINGAALVFEETTE